jgi:hypothetical protein
MYKETTAEFIEPALHGTTFQVPIGYVVKEEDVGMCVVNCGGCINR